MTMLIITNLSGEKEKGELRLYTGSQEKALQLAQDIRKFIDTEADITSHTSVSEIQKIRNYYVTLDVPAASIERIKKLLNDSGVRFVYLTRIKGDIRLKVGEDFPTEQEVETFMSRVNSITQLKVSRHITYDNSTANEYSVIVKGITRKQADAVSDSFTADTISINWVPVLKQ